MRRFSAALVVGIGWLLLSPALTFAAPAEYVLVSDQATLAKSEAGAMTAAYTLVNLTDRPAPVSLTTTEAGQHCAATPGPAVLPASRQQKVTFTLDKCDLPDGGTTGFTLRVGTRSFAVTAAAEAAPDPDWGVLWVFLWTLGGGAVAVLAGRRWFHQRRPAGVPAEPAHAGWQTALPHLGASWSFKDSWASNVTLVSAVFTGLFGTSDLLKSIAGEAVPSVLAVVTIGSAIGIAIVGVAPLVLQAFRNDQSQVLVGGLLVSAALAVGASGGLVLVISRSVSSLVTGWGQYMVWVGTVVALLLLASYAVASVRQNLATGLRPPAPKPGPATAEEQSAALDAVKEAAQADVSEQEFRRRVVPQLQAVYPTYGTSYGDDRPSALI